MTADARRGLSRRTAPLVLMLGIFTGGAIGLAIAKGLLSPMLGVAAAVAIGITVGVIVFAARGKSSRGGKPE